ncbi:hypothetical protein FRB91_006665 [Serendipita sp. 411]|nr:hypothetical protein FRC18_004772 [Serendipita sp. 400]KAG8839969.1 hypothetical protein FRB91_006665 [Serendipita sp. 411]
MKSLFTAFALLLLAIPHVAAHYRFTTLIVNGAATTPWQYVRQSNNSNSPITDVSSTNLRCNSGGASGGSTQTATVAAGATVGFKLDQAIFHAGVLNVYMTKVSNAATADGSTGWFKIYQVSAVTGGGTIFWPTDNATQFTFKIPSSISAGQYLLRVEHIALHSAASTNGAQFYISCAQLNVTGGGSASPSTVQIPGVYSASDPGILINIYYPVPTSYKQPGPAVFTG